MKSFMGRGQGFVYLLGESKTVKFRVTNVIDSAKKDQITSLVLELTVFSRLFSQ